MSCPRSRLLLPLLISQACNWARLAAAEDWPMWRCDAGHSATTTQELPAALHLQWERQFPALTPAWPDQRRMKFDVTYEPVVMGKAMFVASPRSDSVMALDTETAAVKWVFYAEGPVRFAPAAWQGKLYLASDDGYLYCLDAADGRVLWRFSGAPADRRVLGNERLISTWPARGAPVVTDGKVYFAAGIWPFMGIFLYALDAQTGRVLWCNDGTGATYMLQAHSSPAFAGVAPQGYLAAIGDKLLVPGGRTVPACFDRQTGKLLYYRLVENEQDGSFDVACAGSHFLNSNSLFKLEDGLGYGFADIPRPAVLTEKAVYYADETALVAGDVTSATTKTIRDEEDGRDYKHLSMRSLWHLKGELDAVWLKAGSQIVASVGSEVFGVAEPAPGTGAKVRWRMDVGAKPSAMLAADGKLFVVTLDGRIQCYGARDVAPARHAYQAAPPQVGALPLADGVLRETGVTEGYGLVLGLRDLRLVEALAQHSRLNLIVVDADPARVDAARRTLDAAGLYGSRVAVHLGDPYRFPFPPYLASVVVCQQTPVTTADGKALAAQLARVLRPYGGAACLPLSPTTRARIQEWTHDIGLQGARFSQRGRLALLTREGPLPGAGTWTGQYGDAGNTCVSADSLVRAPLGVLWFGGTSNATILPRHGHGPPEQVLGGRLFIEGPDTMRATDVYTGRLLWQTSLRDVGAHFNETDHQPGANALGTNFLATEDVLYVVRDRCCYMLDPATGHPMGILSIPGAEAGQDPQGWGYIGVDGDTLIAGASPVIFQGKERPGLSNNWDATSSKRLIAMNRYSGKVLWQRQAEQCFRHNAIALGAGKVFCIDRMPDPVVKILNHPGDNAPDKVRLCALDVQSGAVVWSTRENVFGTWLGYSGKYDVLLQAGRCSADMLSGEPYKRLITYRGKDGTLLWDKEVRYLGPCLLHDDTIITQSESAKSPGLALNLLTGQPRLRKDPLTGAELPWQYIRQYGCNTVIGSTNLLTFRSAAAGFYDLTTDAGTGNLGGFKSGCTSNLVVADGVLNAPDYTRTCVCSYQNQTSLALVHDPEVETWSFTNLKPGKGPVRRVGVNLGAPGDRVAEDGTLWLDYPSVGGPSPDVPVSISPDTVRWFRNHSSRVTGERLRWVAASGAVGLDSLTMTLAEAGAAERLYSVRLYFAEPDEVAAGGRVFHVSLQGREVVHGLDIVSLTGGPRRVLMKEFQGIAVRDKLTVALSAAEGSVDPPLLCGVSVTAEGW